MSTPVKSWLDNAILQSVAESYLELYSQFGGRHTDLAELLRAGVNHLEKNPDGQGATRLTDTQFAWFDTNYTIVSHYPSDNSGFSCTLFKNNATGEYTLSFRSTEYQFQSLGGDWERDGSGAADGDISKYGFALGQLSSMETFYSNLKQGNTWDNLQKAWVDSPKAAAFASGTPPLTVTGYSLGGHLSSTFTLLHGADVAQTYNFNAAGLGGIDTEANSSRAPTGASIAHLLDLYNNMMAWDGLGAPIWWSKLPTVGYGLISDYVNAAQAHPGALADLNNIYASAKHRTAMEILGYLTTGAGVGDSEDGVLGGLGIMQTKDAAGNWLASTGNGPLKRDPNAFESNLFGELAAPGLTQIYGHGEFWDPQMVANGGYHVANTNAVWIEDLPASRGLGILELVSDSFRNYVGDFGETHSITPLIDSLTVLDMLQQLAPDISMATYTSAMKSMSNRTDTLSVGGADLVSATAAAWSAMPYGVLAAGVAAQSVTSDKLYDADAMENMVNTLSKLFLDTDPQLMPVISVTGYADLTNREKLHQAIAAIEASTIYQQAKGTLQIDSLVGMAPTGIAAKAKQVDVEGMAYRYALVSGNPFVVSGSDAPYAAHNANGELDLYDPATNTGNLTGEYLTDRAAYLSWKMKYDSGQHDDNDVVTAVGDKPYAEQWDSDKTPGNWDFIDHTLKPDGNPLTLTLAIDGSGTSRYDHQIVFGSPAADTVEGSGDTDRLYGMSGDDTLQGNGGNDYLEGGQGNDTYIWNDGLLSDDGLDTLRDTDGLGSIVINGQTLGAGETKDGGHSYTHTDAGGGKHTYTVLSGDINSAEGATLLIDNALNVLNYHAGDLGLTLGDAAPLPPNPLIFGKDDPTYYAADSLSSSTACEMHAGFGNDTLIASAQADLLYGEDGHDAMFGRDGDDELHGGFGNDLLNGGLADDLLYGEDGNDLLVGQYGNDVLYGGEGNDWLFAGDGNDILLGGAGDDTLYGGDNDDYLDGGDNNDILWGGAGNIFIGEEVEVTGSAFLIGRKKCEAANDAEWRMAA
ncbi:MAG: calcium-binding protein [Halothiobacillaceae bacterium]|nr:calcium-binding protein [Halothiobacillaceae bacterium]